LKYFLVYVQEMRGVCGIKPIFKASMLKWADEVGEQHVLQCERVLSVFNSEALQIENQYKASSSLAAAAAALLRGEV
jgi:hypothetical protein